MDANSGETVKSRSATLIPLDWQNYERRRKLMHSRALFRKHGWETNVKFADRRYTDARVSGAEIAEVIQKSPSDLVAIIDEEFAFDEQLFSWLAGFDEKSEVHCAYQRFRAAKPGTNFFLAIYSLLVSLLFRIAKNRYRPGVVVFYRNQYATAWIPETDDFCLTEFLALAKLDGHPIRETLLGPRSQLKNPIRSRAVIERAGQAIRFWWNRIMFPAASQVNNQTVRPLQPKKLSPPKQALSWLLLGVATVMVLSMNLGYPLLEPEETRNVQIALNILQSNDWHFLELAGQPYWDQPPLSAWATASSLRYFGNSEFAARLPGNLAAMLTIFISVALGRRLIGFRAALIAGLLLLTSIGFVFSGRFITTDSAVALSTTVALLAGYLAVQKDQFALKWWLVAASAGAVGVLIKGPLVLLLDVPPLLLICWLTGKRSLRRKTNWLWFALPIIAIAGPWVIAMICVHPGFLAQFLGKPQVAEVVSAFTHQQPFWYYLPVIAIGMFPASCLLPALYKQLSGRDPNARGSRTPEVGFLILCAAWVVGFFSLSPSKTPTAVLPAIPFLCLALGWLLDSVVCSANPSRLSSSWLKRTPKQVGLILIAMTTGIQLLLIWYFGRREGFLFFTILVPVGLLLIARLTFRQKSKARVAWSGLAVVAITFSVYSVDRLAPAVSESRSLHRATALLKEDPEFARAKVIFFGQEDFGAALQLERQHCVSFKPEELNYLCDYICQHPWAIVIAGEDAMTNLCQVLDPAIQLKSAPQHQHLYTCCPHNVRSARAARPQTIKAK